MDVIQLDHKTLFDQVLQLRNDVLHQAAIMLDDPLYKGQDHSMRRLNLAHYLALRSFELRQLQQALSKLSISSLGHSESHVLANIQGILDLLAQLTRQDYHPEAAQSEQTAETTLEANTKQLFGHHPSNRKARIMVTLPTQAAWDEHLIPDLLKQGVNCFRINCAHDQADIWHKMVKRIRAAEEELHLHSKIMFDLAGHKLRTNPLLQAKPVKRIKTQKNPLGAVIEYGQVCFYPDEINPEDMNCPFPLIPLPTHLYPKLKPADSFFFKDARGKQRAIKLVEKNPDHSWHAMTEQTCYLTPNLKFHWQRIDKKGHLKEVDTFSLPLFNGEESPIRLLKDDLLWLSAKEHRCKPALYNARGQLEKPAILSIAVPEVINQLQTGHGVWVDDGKLGCVVEKVTQDGAQLRVTIAGSGGVRVKADKGVNFPDTALNLPSLTEKDLADLDFICQHGDMVAFSFVQRLSDIHNLQQELIKRDCKNLPIIAKIETRLGVQNLAQILLGTVDQHPMGVMIARGDLAIELGSVKMAEIQEDILCVCEAAQVPVVWATQVLETLNKTGVISRPEITDAAMSVRAECVMLNKGTYLPETVKVLNAILENMEPRQQKRLFYLNQWSL
ncbi:pyruvate kinase [Thiomicrospira microaerophila]|uniref:pyruvate kinase n=1 Tax=Thiomicrospira microaerophila TaxID=406020 RepID=UPI0005C91FE8|nr:pyruvate kinase [Thiomicrospira microaerophila]